MRESIDNVNSTGKSFGRGRARAAGDDVLDQVHTLMHRYRALRQRSLRTLSPELTHMDMKVLGFFAHHPGATQSDLAQRSGRDKAQLARLVKGLRERGLLDAQADADDRRNLRLHLTPAGEELQRHLHQQAHDLGVKAVAGLSEAERAQLRDLLLRVDANLQKLSDKE